MSRPETGPMQFEDDWTGIFIRGDDPFAFALYLGFVIDKVPPGSTHYVRYMRKLQRLLAKCDHGNDSRPEPQQAILVSKPEASTAASGSERG